MHYVVFRTQVLVISSAKVKWAKQGTCTLVDNEPSPPTDPTHSSENGWKEVTNFRAVMGGGNFLFPKDQLLQVLDDGTYKPIESRKGRELDKLSATKKYLVWYHHLLTNKNWTEKLRLQKDKTKK